MKTAFTLASVFFTASLAFAQGSVINNGLGKAGATVNHASHEQCGAMRHHEHLMNTDPAYVQRRSDIEAHYQQYLKNPVQNKVTYTIPVVVHVIHLGTAIGVGANITDAQIQSAIDNLNDAYSNTSTAHTTYTGVNTNIQFCLAVRDPNGNATTGINRVDGSGVTNYSTYGLCDGDEPAIGNADNEVNVKALSKWDNTKYYNIWVVTEINNNDAGVGTQGFAYFPGAGSSVDGTIIMYNSFGYDPDGSLGYNLKSYTNRNVTTLHEIGHALNLFHTFEGDGTGSTCPSNTTCTTQGDRVCDTPPHKRSNSDCNTAGTNSCDGGSSNSLFVHNIMDYSSDVCQTEFTAGQSTRMQAVVQAGGGRVSLMSSDGCNPVYTNEASMFAIVTPSTYQCGSSIDPVVTIKNTGSATLTSLTISYTIDGGSAVNFSWTGSLASGASTNVTLANAVVSAGSHSFEASLSNPNGVTDPFSSNDTKSTSFTASGSTPATTCNVNTINTGNWDKEIIRVQFNDIDYVHDDNLNDGVQDFTCEHFTTLNYNASYTLTVTTDGSSVVKAWLDFNDDGAYTNDEIVLTSSSGTSHSATVNIPQYPTVTGKIIRLRIASDNTTITACNDLNYGEVEDIGVNINTPPCVAPSISGQPADFGACSGATGLTCTVSGPSLSYQWQISTDGGSSYSNISNGGVYSNATTATLNISDISGLTGNLYRCYVNNSCGNATSNAATITETTAPAAACNVTTTNHSNFCTGVVQFQFNTINNSHNDFANEDTQDFTCSNNTTVSAGATYAFTATTYYNVDQGCGYDSRERLTIWIDYDNDGTFNNTNERVYKSTSVSDIHTGNITIPASGATYNNLLRMRVKTDLYDVTDACLNSEYGETEDYAVFIPCSFFTTLDGASCGKTLTSLDEALYATSVPCATNYRYEVRSAIDNSLIGVSVRGASDNLFRMSWLTGVKYNSNYKIRVSVYVNGAWKPWGGTCNVITPLPRLMNCDQTLTSLSDAIMVTPVQGATNYRIAVVNYAAPFNAVSVKGSSDNTFRLSWISGTALNTKYQVRVSAYVNGYWRPWGPVCYVTTPVSPTQLSVGSCGASIPSLTAPLYCDAVSNATNYRYEIRKASDNSLVSISTRGAADNLFRMSWVTGVQSNTTYKVRVAAYCNGIWGDFATSCNVTTPATIVLENGTLADEAVSNELFASVELDAYPNPSRGEVTISTNVAGTHQLVNELGQIIRTFEINPENGMKSTLTDLSQGIYFVTVHANNEIVSRKITIID